MKKIKNVTWRLIQLGLESAGFGLCVGSYIKTGEYGYIVACLWILVAFTTHWRLWNLEKKGNDTFKSV